MNKVMLPEHMRNEGMAEVRSVGLLTGILAWPPRRCNCVALRRRASHLRWSHGMPCCSSASSGLMQGGKARMLKYLPIVEARMKDGRKYIAGDEFTAAGEPRAVPDGNGAWLLLTRSESLFDAVYLHLCISRKPVVTQSRQDTAGPFHGRQHGVACAAALMTHVGHCGHAPDVARCFSPRQGAHDSPCHGMIAHTLLAMRRYRGGARAKPRGDGGFYGRREVPKARGAPGEAQAAAGLRQDLQSGKGGVSDA